MTQLIDPSKPAGQIVGTAMCPHCALKGGDGDSCRANLGNDRRVSCIMCGRVSNQVKPEANAIFAQPAEVKAVVADLISSNKVADETYRVASVLTGEGVGAVAQGFGPDDIMTSVQLARGEFAFQTVSISYTGNDLKSAANPAKDFGAGEAPAGIPAEAKVAVDKLVAHGFRVTGANLEGMKQTVILVKGKRLRGTPTILGVRAEVSWS